MRVLGVSAFDMDASVALVVDGEVAAAAAEERFTRQAHDPNLPRFAAEWALAHAGLRASQLDAVAFADDPGATFSRVLLASLHEGFPFGASSFAGALKPWLASRLWIRDGLSRLLDVHPDLVRCVPRARALAANAAIAAQGAAGSAGAPAVAVLVVDSAGAWPCTTLGRASFDDGRLVVEELESFAYPHSLGLLLTSFAVHAGFRARDEEADFLALAPFGDPLLAERVRRMLRAQPDGTYCLDPWYFRFSRLDARADAVPWTPAFVDLCGPPRDSRRSWPFEPAGRGGPVAPEDKRFADLAASLRLVLDAALAGLARRARLLAGADLLALGGGVFADPARVAALAHADSRPLAVPPDPGPGGAARGAAALCAGETGVPVRLCGAAVGRAWEAQRDLDALELVDPRYWQRFRRRGASPVGGLALRQQPVSPAVVAAALSGGAAVGWLLGRFGVGRGPDPGRCVLADPALPAAVRRVRRSILGLPVMRGLVIGVPREAVASIVDDPGRVVAGQPWAAVQCQPTPSAADQFPEVLDAEGQVLVVVLDEAGPLAAVARALHTSMPALVLAPLAEEGWPPAGSPADALIVFMRTDLDHLVLDTTLVTKERRCPTPPTGPAPAEPPSSP